MTHDTFFCRSQQADLYLVVCSLNRNRTALFGLLMIVILSLFFHRCLFRLESTHPEGREVLSSTRWAHMPVLGDYPLCR